MRHGTQIPRQREGTMKIGKGETGKKKIGNLIVGMTRVKQVAPNFENTTPVRKKTTGNGETENSQQANRGYDRWCK